MDFRRLVVFIVLSIGLLFLWGKYVSPEQPSAQNIQSSISTQQKIPDNNVSATNNSNVPDSATALKNDKAQIITVTTNTIQAQISTLGGDIKSVDLLNHSSQDDVKHPYQLLLESSGHEFIAQTGLVASNSNYDLPTHNSIFNSDKLNYVLEPGQNSVKVSLTTQNNGIQIIKTYTFTRDSYVVDMGYQIVNDTSMPLTGVSAYWRLLRDEAEPEGETRFANTFTGPAYYTNEDRFNKIKFSNLAKNDVTYPEIVKNGWVGFVQHYFAAMWLLNAYNYQAVCNNGITCRLNFKQVSNLASAGVITDLPSISAHSTYTVAVPLFVGPQAYNVLMSTAPGLELTKDYGWVYIFATPLFWLLVKLFGLVNNWGWAIVLLTIVVKTVLYPLTRASYISMAKMKALAPKMDALRTQYGDDKMKLQQAIMQLYRSEKVNPIGGCLPMILQIPVFIGLYWALLSSVELRQAQFLWIHDLSKPDPYYIMPLALAITMFLQTFLNPPSPSADPVQAKMMKIMPVAFSVMFFFFPAGLVLYWLINNVLTMAQQWYVNNHVSLRKANREKKKHH